MKKYKIRTNLDFCLGDGPNDVESPDPVSLTVPGMTTPLNELVNRYMAGREIPVHAPVYEGHINIPDVRTMDKVDRELYARQVRQQIADYRNRLAEHNEKEKADKVSALEAKIKQLEQQRNTENLNEGGSGL